jgi:hypothetical protein
MDMTQEIIEMIRGGDLDFSLTQIRDACKVRSAVLAGQEYQEESRQDSGSRPTRYRKGDEVRINSTTIRPKYVNGKVFKVVRHNRTTVTVGPIPSDPAYGRFAGLRELRIPVSAVELA